jgi:uncharacterized protein YjbI with pentapeptide repeats
MQSFINGRDFMTRDESIALYERAQAAEREKEGEGRKVWNAWAEEMLTQKSELERRETWKNGPKTQSAWREAATVDFLEHTFHDADLAGYIFPAEAGFRGATFEGATRFDTATFEGVAGFVGAKFREDTRFDRAAFKVVAGFGNAKCEGIAWFVGATFEGDAWFDSAKFKGDARFDSAKFKEDARFYRATFKKDGRFDSATFNEDARFDSAKFARVAWFDSATFKEYARFDSATFKGDARFDSAKFEGDTRFDGTTFKEDTRFRGAKCDGSFSLNRAGFQKVPDFSQTRFSEAPRLDNMSIRLGLVEPQGAWRRILARVKPSIRPCPDDAARYRALKGLALKGHDLDSELSFFAGEVTSRRGNQDFALPRPWRLVCDRKAGADESVTLVWRWNNTDFDEWPKIWPGGVRYWAGQAYETLSDFGRSMLRPLFWWIVLMGMYAVAYLSQYFVTSRHTTGLGGLVEAYRWTGTSLLNKLSFGAFAAPADLACHSASKLVVASKMEPWGAAGYVAARRALILNTGDDDDKLSFAYACLYGDYSDVTQARFRVIPHIPDAVSVLAIMQSLLSAALIFLFLLAVRNQFRIK